MKISSPAFQFYPADWLSSPKVTTMTPAEEGAYIRLLCYAWADLDCSIPDDDTELAQLSRLGEGWLKGGSTAIRKCFEPHPKRAGRLFNARLMEERKKQEAWRKKSREGGKRSAESRALRAKQGSTVVEGCLNGGATVVQPNGNSSSSSFLKSFLQKEKTCATFEAFWKAYPKKRGKGQAEKAWTKLKPDSALLEQILAAIDKAKHTPEWIQDNGRFIPYPGTWINGKRWEDEYSQAHEEKVPL